MEIDVNCSKDGVFYLLHGPQVEHLTSAPGYFANFNGCAARLRAVAPDFQWKLNIKDAPSVIAAHEQFRANIVEVSV